MTEKILNKALFGKKVRNGREKLGLTQFALADSIGVSQNFLGDIERGTKLPSLETLIRLSNVLKVSLDSLLADSLNVMIAEDENIVYNDKQLSIIKNVIKTITDNFEN